MQMCCFRKSICIWSLLLVIAELSMQLLASFRITTVNKKFTFVIHKYFNWKYRKKDEKPHANGGILEYMVIL